MTTAILVISSASLVCSAGCLVILIKAAKEAQTVKAEVDTVKVKVANSARLIKHAIDGLEN